MAVNIGNSIFVQIAAYRDAELLPTIRDMIAKANNPNRLTFGICWQHTDTETLAEFIADKRFRIISVNWNDSKGCCWARSKTQSLYAGEDYTLQIDSHMRFVEGWDDQLIEMIKMIDHPKPIISYYPPPYEIKDGKIELCGYTVPQAIIATRFESGFIPYFGSDSIPEPRTKPTIGKFIAAGMLFTIGQFCNDIPYNPEIYFLGEEIDIALRSYTKGYNVYHPHKSVCWHYFIRKGEPRHWEDHTDKNVKAGIIKENFASITYRGFSKLKRLLWEDSADLGLYSLGTKRSRKQFEEFAGIKFKELHITPAVTTVQHKKEKPFIYSTPFLFKKTITIDLTKIPKLDDYVFWYFGLHGAEHNELYRQDLKSKEYLLEHKNTVDVDVFLLENPITYTIWPVSKSKGWQQRITNNL